MKYDISVITENVMKQFNLYHTLDKLSRRQIQDILLNFLTKWALTVSHKTGFTILCKWSPKEIISVKHQRLSSGV